MPSAWLPETSAKLLAFLEFHPARRFRMDLHKYRTSKSEQARAQDLLRILPSQGRSVLEIGARDGFFSRLLAERFETVTALDLDKPSIQLDRVVPFQGDVRRLAFPDHAFDCVVCTEVLEHVVEVDQAAAELARVARQSVVVGVPYRQDIRLGRTTCAGCGKINPPWGHVNRFDEKRLRRLFAGLRPVTVSWVWRNRDRTNALSAWLMNRAGNPWGTYHQEEPCIHCGSRLRPPAGRSIVQKVCAALAHRLNRVQRWLVRPRPNWIHMVFHKRAA
jgi:ubiquinone/menaquinone biosynthesis C-methylase UbiE